MGASKNKGAAKGGGTSDNSNVQEGGIITETKGNQAKKNQRPSVFQVVKQNITAEDTSDDSTVNNTANVEVIVVGETSDEREVVITNNSLTAAIEELDSKVTDTDTDVETTLKVNVSDQDANTGNIEMEAIKTLVDLTGDDSHRVENIEFDMTDGSITFNVEALKTVQEKAGEAA